MQEAFAPGHLVVVHCSSPKEKMWGVLLRLDPVGVVVRGLDLNSVEDWMRQEAAGGDALVGPSTLFVPSHRVERMYLDERAGAVESFGERFRQAAERDAVEALLAGRETP